MLEGYYSELIESTGYMIVIFDEAGNILYKNESFQKIVGIEPDSLELANIWQVINPYSKQLCKSEFSQASRGDRFELAIVLTCLDGTILYTDGKFNCSYDEKNERKIFAGILQDITELSEREVEFNTLRNQLDEKTHYWKLLHKTYVSLINEHMEQFDDNMTKALALFGRLVYADRAFIFEYDMDNLTVSNTYEWCEEGIIPKRSDMQNLPFSLEDGWINNHLSGLPVYIEDVDALNDDDYVKSTVKPYGVKSMVTFPMISEGVLYGSVGFDSVRIIRSNADIEKQMLSELSTLFLNAIQRRRIHERLKERDLRFNSYISKAPMGIFVCDFDYKLHEVNDAFCQLTGYQPEALIGEKLTLLFDEAELERAKEKFSSSDEINTVKFNYIGRHADGSVFNIQIASAVVGNNEIISFCYDPLEI